MCLNYRGLSDTVGCGEVFEEPMLRGARSSETSDVLEGSSH